MIGNSYFGQFTGKGKFNIGYRGLLKLLCVLLCSCSSYMVKAQLVLNEVSQGTAGAKEYVELVVMGTRACGGDSTADIRGWYLDDNNGWLGAGTGQGIAQGSMRFANSATWAKVPYGSIILVYNDGDKNGSITLPDDPTDANHDNIYIVPASSTEMENTGTLPSASPANPNYVYSATGFNSGGDWLRMGLANTGDAVIITSPANPAAAYFSFGYGTLANTGAATVYIPTSGGGKCYYLSNDKYNMASSWVAGSSPGNETPGVPNSTANTNWINSMKIASAGGTIVRDTVILKGCSSITHDGVTYTASTTLIDTVKASGGCDSAYHYTNIVIQSLSNITITASGPTTFCAGGSVTLSAPVSSSTNDGLNFTATGKYVDPKALPAFYDNFTFECWVNPANTITLASEATSGTGGTSGERYVLYPTWGGSNNTVNNATNPDAGAGLSVGTNGIAVYEHGAAYLTPLLVWPGTVSGWTHIAIVYINKQPSLYINGVFVKTGLTSLKNRVYPSLGQWTGNLYSLFGGIGGGNYGYFGGQIDEFRLWDVALTPAAILANYNKIVPPSTADLYAYYRFDEGTGNTAADLTGNDATGATLVSNPAWMVPSSAPITGYTSDYTYLWTPGNQTDPSIIVTAPGTYTVTVTNTAGCSGTASVVVKTIVPVTENQTLVGCSSVTYKGITYTAPATIKDTVRSIGGCDSVYHQTDILIQPVTPVTQSTTLSECKSVLYKGITYTSSVVVKDTLKSTGGCDSVYHEANIVIQPITPVTQNSSFNDCNSIQYNGITYSTSTIVKDTLRSTGGCDSVFKVISLTVDLSSSVNVRDSFYQGQTYTLPSGTVVNASGTYQSILKKSNGCDSTINTTLVMLPVLMCNIDPPKAFTPNGDGFNDVWKVFTESCVRQAKVSVYNRWGGLVYHSDNYQNDWNGRYKNDALPDATYYYIIEVIYGNHNSRISKGNVTIMR